MTAGGSHAGENLSLWAQLSVGRAEIPRSVWNRGDFDPDATAATATRRLRGAACPRWRIRGHGKASCAGD